MNAFIDALIAGWVVDVSTDAAGQFADALLDFEKCIELIDALTSASRLEVCCS